MSDMFDTITYALEIEGTALDVAAIGRGGARAPIVFLHGFGSTKEDYADIVHHRAFDGRPFLAYDAPGCGESRCADLVRIDIPFLVSTAESVLERARIERFHLVGHSMGGRSAVAACRAVAGRRRCRAARGRIPERSTGF